MGQFRPILSHIKGVKRAILRQRSAERILMQIEKIEANALLRVARITEDKEKRIAKLKVRAVRFADLLLEFFEKNRMVLPQNSSRTAVETDAGSFEWYPGADSIEVTDEVRAIDELKAIGHAEAVRVREELDKNFLLEHPEIVKRVRGIAIVQHPKSIMRFPDTKARLELPKPSKGQALWEIITPKKKK